MADASEADTREARLSTAPAARASSTAWREAAQAARSYTAPMNVGSNTPNVAATTDGVGVPSAAARPHTYASKNPSPSDANRSIGCRDHQPWVAMGSSASRRRRATLVVTRGAG